MADRLADRFSRTSSSSLPTLNTTRSAWRRRRRAGLGADPGWLHNLGWYSWRFRRSNISTLQQYAVAPTAARTAPTRLHARTGGTVTVGGTPVQVGIFAHRRAELHQLPVADDVDGLQHQRQRPDPWPLHLQQTGHHRHRRQLPVFYTPLVQPFHLVNLSEYHTFSPSITNELRAGIQPHRQQTFTVPDIDFPGLGRVPERHRSTTWDNSTSVRTRTLPNISVQNTYQLVDNLTWTKGNHTLKFGVEGRKSISPQLFIQRSRGDYEWVPLEGYALDQVPDFGQRSFGSVGYSGDQYGVFWYVNDIWKIRPNFSLNLGLRYEYTSTPYGWTQMALNDMWRRARTDQLYLSARRRRKITCRESDSRGLPVRVATRRSGAVSAWATTFCTTTSEPYRARRRSDRPRTVRIPSARPSSWPTAESRPNPAAASPSWTRPTARRQYLELSCRTT